MRSSYITESAKGEECQVRIPGACNGNPETTVLAHVGKNRERGIKCDDTFAVFACSSCHDEIDRRMRLYPNEQVTTVNFESVERTQRQIFEKRLLHAD
ncbi:DUF1364 family protein [Agarivorans sp. B2Z047]|nr:DUF1364 family protein [Agarivorans sp. B2Z047]